MTKIEEVSISSKVRDLKEPFVTALRTVSTFEIFECVVKTSDGRTGAGECVETPVITGDTKTQILLDLHGPVNSFLQGRSFSTYSEIAPELAQLPTTASARAAADMALYNLDRITNPEPIVVASDVTVPVAHLDELERLIAARVNSGFSVFKVKLGREEVSLSISKLRKLREIIGSDSRIRVDPNQSWTLTHTIEFLDALSASEIEIDFLEQPTPASEKSSLAKARAHGGVKIMADESCFIMSDLLELIELDAVDLINIKLLKSGGLYGSFEMATVAREAGIGVFIGSMMEGDIGVANAARLAYEVAPHQVHDLDAAWWAKNSSVKYKNGQVSI